MELTRVVLVCTTEDAFRRVKSEADQQAMCGMAVGTGGTCLEAHVVECAPFTAGVIGEATVILTVHNEGYALPAAAATTAAATPLDTEGLLRLSPFCRLQPLLKPLPPLQLSTDHGAWVPQFCGRPGSAAEEAVSAAGTPEGWNPLTDGIISAQTALRHQMRNGSIAMVKGTDTSTTSDAPYSGACRGLRVWIAPAAASQPPCDAIRVGGELFSNAFPHGGPQGLATTTAATAAPVTLAEVVPQASLPIADWVEIRPAAVPYQSVLEGFPGLFDAALERHFAGCAAPLMHLQDLLTIPLPCSEADLPALAALDFDRLTEGNATPMPPSVLLVVTKAGKGGELLNDTPFVFKKGVTELALLTTPVPRRGASTLPFGDDGGCSILPDAASATPAALCAGLGLYTEVVEFFGKILGAAEAGGSAYSGTLLLTGDEGDAAGILQNGGALAVQLAARRLGCHLLEKSATVVDKSDVEKLIGIAGRSPPTVLFIRDVEALFGATEAPGAASGTPDAPEGGQGSSSMYFLSRLTDALEALPHGCILCCAATLSGTLPSDFAAFFQKSIQVGPPSAPERSVFFEKHVAPNIAVSKSVTGGSFAKLTAGMTLLSLRQICSAAVKEAGMRVQGLVGEEGGGGGGDFPGHLLVEHSDFTAAVSAYSKAHQLNVSTNVQKVSWKDIGGLKEAKEEILECIHLPLSQPQLFKDSGLKARTGILLYGPPGCGKTLLAKGVATECGLNFISVKGPEMLNMYVGESERNIRELFAKARRAAPCVIFFDELDALVPNRGAKGDSGGVMDRIVAQLLTEVDSLGGDPDSFVFIIGATNRPDLIDQSLLRPGRFDRCVYLGVASNTAEQATILKAQTRKMNVAPDVDLHDLASGMPKTYSGADLYALTTEALMIAMREKVNDLVASVEQQRSEMEAAEDADPGDTDSEDAAAGGGGGDTAAGGGDADRLASIVVSQEHLVEARKASGPSITVGDLARYQAMKDQFNTTT